MMRKFLLALLVAILPLSACDSDSTGTGDDGSEASIAGTYALKTANGQPIPASFNDDGTTVQVTAGSLTLRADRTFAVTLTFQATINGGVMTETDGGEGTFTRNGNQLTFNFTGDTPLTGTLSGRQVTIDSGDGLIFVFER